MQHFVPWLNESPLSADDNLPFQPYWQLISFNSGSLMDQSVDKDFPSLLKSWKQSAWREYPNLKRGLDS